MTVQQDLRYAIRMVRRAPGFAAAAVLSLALGIGANTAIFTLLNAVVLRLLPVNHPQELVQLTYTYPGTPPDNWNSYFGYTQLERFQRLSTMLTSVFGGTIIGRVNVGLGSTTGLARADGYTDNFFAVLGVGAQRGRLFAAGDDRTGADVVVLSDGYWRRRFGADPAVVGRTMTINQLPFLVIGVTPTGFTGISVGSAPDLWVPMRALDRFKPDPSRWTAPFTSWILTGGRLRPGVTLREAQAELDVVHRQLLGEQLTASEQRGSESMRRMVAESHLVLRPAATGMYSGLRESYELPLKLLLAVAGMVLLIACANVANLLLARASNRRREIAVRLALGAGRARVVRQLLVESLLLAALAAPLALGLAWGGSTVLVRMISTGDAPLPLNVSPDWRIFGFTAALSLATGMLFGLAPAVRGTRLAPGLALHEGARGATRGSRVLDRALVISQVALSLVLLTGAGLFTRSLQKLWSVDVGYRRDNVLMFAVDSRLAGYPPGAGTPLYVEILRRVGGISRVQAAGVSIVRPVDNQYYLTDRVRYIDGRQLPERETIPVAWNAVGPGYFSAIGTNLLLGRDFGWREATPVVIVNESLARAAFPGMNPVGHRLDAGEIIGVVKDSVYGDVREQRGPVLYKALFQADGATDPSRWAGVGDVSFELRYAGSGAGLVDEVRRAVGSVDRNVPIFRVKTLRAQTEDSFLRERLLAMLAGFFGGLALVLACVGLYGLMAYAVARRAGEIGIRMALGARRGHILGMVVGETLGLAAAGIAAGIPLALWGAHSARSLLFGVSTADPAAIVPAAALLALVAGLAGYLPARKAARVDPMAALRCE